MPVSPIYPLHGLRRVCAARCSSERAISLTRLLLAGSSLFFVMLADARLSEAQPDGDAAAELRRLDSVWGGWTENVKSLEIKGHHFFGTCQAGSNALLRRDLERFVTETMMPAVERGARDLGTLNRLTTPIFSDPNRAYADGPRPPTGGWRPYRFVESGGKRRTDEKLLGTISRVRKDGKEEQYSSGARQVSLFPSESNIHMEKISDFVYVPDAPKRKLSWTLTRLDGKCHLESGGSVLDYDEKTGFVERRVERAGEDFYLRERFQAMPISTSAGVPIAQFIADATFWQGGNADTAPVHGLHIYLLDTLAVNEVVEPTAFALAVPAATNIVKFESADNSLSVDRGGKRPAMRRTEQPVADARAFAATPDFERPGRPPHPPADEQGGRGWSRFRVAFVAVNAILLLAVFVWAIRRR